MITKKWKRVSDLKRGVGTLLHQAIQWRLPIVEPRILRSIPHKDQPFTQGLAYHEGWLYESSGGVPDSFVRRIDPDTGRVDAQAVIANDFAEGLAICDDRLIVLSWKSNKARVYDLGSFTLHDTLYFSGEGWGLASTTDGFVMSNGTSILQFRDASFRLKTRMKVSSHRLPVRRLNDLEWADGFIYANIWKATELCEIESDNGRLRRLVDCSALVSGVVNDSEAVLNGIAYNASDRTFFVTGKRWRHIFELTIPQ